METKASYTLTCQHMDGDVKCGRAAEYQVSGCLYTENVCYEHLPDAVRAQKPMRIAKLVGGAYPADSEVAIAWLCDKVATIDATLIEIENRLLLEKE